MITEDTIQEFEQFLILKRLSEVTIKEYKTYYRRFQETIKQYGLYQEVIDAYMIKWKSNSVCVAFLKQYLEFITKAYKVAIRESKQNNLDKEVITKLADKYMELKEIEIIKQSGRTPRKKINVMSKSEVARVIDYLYRTHESIRYALMVMLTYYCGLRLQEIKSIKIPDFNLTEWKEQSNRGVKLKIHGKGKRERIVIVPPKVMRALKPYLLERVNEIKNIDIEPLFNKCQTIQKKFKMATQNVANKRYRFHELRHSRSYHWYKEGKDIMQIKNRLGHSSIGTTQLYINPEEEKEISTWQKEETEAF